ncbi:MAG: glycoside hydrolase domain-containing protein [Polyangiaceae bacterium]
MNQLVRAVLLAPFVLPVVACSSAPPENSGASSAALQVGPAAPGLDNAGALSVGDAVYYKSNYGIQWSGAYIGGPCNGGSGWTPSVLSSINAATGWQFMPIYVGQNGPGIGCPTNLTSGQGTADGEDAVAVMKSYAWAPHANIPVCLDVESETYGGDPGDTTAYVHAWLDAVHAGGYLAYVYSNPDALIAFADDGLPIDGAWVANWEFSGFTAGLSPHSDSSLPNSIYPNRIWQYTDSNGGMDFDTANILLAPAPGKTNQAPRPAFTHGPGTPIALDANGHLTLFAVGGGGAVYVDRQDPSGVGGWAGWREIDGAFTSSSNPSVGVNADGRLEVFAVGTDGQIQHVWESTAGAGDYGNFVPLGGKAVGNAAVALNSSNQLEVFVTGTDGHIYHRWQDPTVAGGWTSEWVGLGGGFVSNPTVLKHPDGNLEVFGVGTDYQAYHAWHDATQPGGWTQWYAMGGNLNSDIGAAINGKGLAETFALDTSGVLDHDFEESSGQWFGWPNVGGDSWSVPAVALNSHGELEAFLGGSGSHLFHTWQASTTTGWSDWASLGGEFSSNFVVGTNADGGLEVFGIGGGGQVFHSFYDVSTGAWSGWMGLGGSVSKI